MLRDKRRPSEDRSSRTGAFGPGLGACLGLSGTSYLALPEGAPYFAVTRLTGRLSDVPHHIPPAHAYLITLHLTPAALEIRRQGQAPASYGCHAGSMGIDSLARPLTMTSGVFLDCLIFYVHRRFLEGQAALLRAPRGCILRCSHGTPDRTIQNIGLALLPLLNEPEHAAPEFLAPIARATCLHLLRTYGSVHAKALS